MNSTDGLTLAMVWIIKEINATQQGGCFTCEIMQGHEKRKEYEWLVGICNRVYEREGERE